MSRGLRPVGSAFETLDEGVEINLDTHAYSFEGAGVTVATDAVNPNLVHVDVSAGVVGGGPPTTIDAGDAPVVGVAPTASHSDHEHGVNTALAANLAAVDAGAASAGVSPTIPRGDHKHTISIAAAVDISQIDAGDAASPGVSVTIPRGDHQHGVNTAVAANLAAVDAAAAAAGVSATLPRGDHKHMASTGVPVAVGTANAPGVAASLSRSDHVHALDIQQRTYQATWLKDLADVLGTTVTVLRALDRNGMVAGAVWTFVSGVYVPNAAVAASAAGNSATLTIVVRTAAGVIVGTLGTITTTVAWVANVPQAVVAGAVLVVNPGEYLTIAIAKTGLAGRVIPAGVLELTFTVA